MGVSLWCRLIFTGFQLRVAEDAIRIGIAWIELDCAPGLARGAGKIM
jgi:hypothetical protein